MCDTNFYRRAISTTYCLSGLVMLAILILIVGATGFVMDLHRNQKFRTNPAYRAELRAEVHDLRLAAGCMQLSQQSSKYDVLMASHNYFKAQYNERAEGNNLQGEMLLDADLPEYVPNSYYGYMIDVWQQCKANKHIYYALNQ